MYKKTIREKSSILLFKRPNAQLLQQTAGCIFSSLLCLPTFLLVLLTLICLAPPLSLHFHRLHKASIRVSLTIKRVSVASVTFDQSLCGKVSFLQRHLFLSLIQGFHCQTTSIKLWMQDNTRFVCLLDRVLLNCHPMISHISKACSISFNLNQMRWTCLCSSAAYLIVGGGQKGFPLISFSDEQV